MSEPASTSSAPHSSGSLTKFKLFYRKNLWLRLLISIAVPLGSYLLAQAFLSHLYGFRNANYEFCAPPVAIPADAHTLDSIRLGRGSSLDMAFSPDQKKLAVASSLGIWVYDVDNMQQPHLLAGHTCFIDGIAWSPDSQHLASASWDKTARIWDVGSGQSLHTLEGHTDDVTAIDWSPDNTKIATAGKDQAIRLWDSTTGKELRTLTGHMGEVEVVRWSPDGQFLASSGNDSTLKVWNGSDGGLRYTVPITHYGAELLAWSSDGTQLAAGNLGGIVQILDADTGEQIHQLGTYHGGDLLAMAWSPDNSQMAVSIRRKPLKVWDVTREQPALSIEKDADTVRALVWSPNGQHITSAGQDHAIRIWNTSGQELEHTDLEGYTHDVKSIDWSPDGTKIVAGEYEGARIWDVVSQKATALFTDTKTPVDQGLKSVKWMPDGSGIGGVDYDATLRIWDRLDGNLTSLSGGSASFSDAVAWSPDGKQLAFFNSDISTRIQILDVTSRQLITLTNSINWTSPGSGMYPSARGIAWSPNGKQLAWADQMGKISIWDVVNAQELRTFDGGAGSVTSLAWSPDGQRLVSGHDNFTARIWEVASGKHLNTLTGHTRWVLSVDWSPDGQRIATGGDDTTVRVWDAVQGKELYLLTGHVDGVNSVKWAPDSKQLASGSDDGTVRVWQMPVDQ